ncbi:MAG: sigma-70 family RNA polymerase sigma factor [Planctomycetia bacterium]|nr:sigma-70 family RNA polymerase sigma factor [Planctomycetia bacterium]
MTDAASVSGITSQSLLARVRRHAPEAWERLSAIYGPLVYQWGRRCGLPAEDAADIVQEVFGVLARRIDDYRGAGKFRAWLWTITRNKVRDHLRRSQAQALAVGGSTAYQSLQQLSDDAPEPWSAEERSATKHSVAQQAGAEQGLAEKGITTRTLELVRAEFEPTTWQAFWIATVEKRTAAEIAASLGITKHAVHQAKYRVLRRLREEFDGLA